MPIDPGDVVYLIVTGAPMTVESVDGDRAVCMFPEYSSRPVPEGCERRVIGHVFDTFQLAALRPDSRKLPCDLCAGTLRGLPCDMYRCENGHERTGLQLAVMKLDDPDRIAFGLVEAFRDR